MFVLGDQVTLATARGGWTGFITQVIGGPVDVLYRVQSPRSGDPDFGMQTVAESDIAAGPIALAPYLAGAVVSLYGQSGTITTVHGDGTVTVTVQEPRMDYTQVRTHRVAHWQIALENMI